MTAPNHEQAERVIDVGEHECVTCKRCACTFARVHPACPRCSQEERDAAQLAEAQEELEVVRAQSEDRLCDLHNTKAQLAEREREREALQVLARGIKLPGTSVWNEMRKILFATPRGER